ncbi:hypothetical protein FH972_026732 [Carpinus fangiana]|uniref:SAP domain-containing protein n=1 Tax=Carpinus fangiana TaxID=176857 RepID=A0A5N6L4V4_9ROSI|nr:hypothetical protein FH972_026732 [Carpinus fangiana]
MPVDQYGASAKIDYASLTVVKLKEELKTRGIPLTGLARKQQIIDRLIQEDAKELQTTYASGDETLPQDGNDGDTPVRGTPAEVADAEHAALAADPQSEAAAVDVLHTEEGGALETRVISQEERDAEVHAPKHSPISESKRKRRSTTPPPEEGRPKRTKMDGAATTDPQTSVSAGLGVEEAGKSEGSAPDVAMEDLPKSKASGKVLDEETPTENTRRELPSTAGLRQSSPADEMKHDEGTVLPALHPATAALYIRNLKRPLQQLVFRKHLETLANETDAILVFHLDAIRTHALVHFSSVKAAVRVRSALHDQVWPAERDREPLWVDFVPEKQIAGWIEQESAGDAGGRGAGAKRWEVIYDTLDDGSVAARLQESSSATATVPLRKSSHAPTAATVEADQSRAATAAATAAAIADKQPAPQAFINLEQHFRSTTSKPKLYWLPVKQKLADARLDEIDDLTTKRGKYPNSGAGWQDSRRYTFEDDDRLVDNGPEFGLRQGGPGGRGGGRGGPFRGRGGDRWR